MMYSKHPHITTYDFGFQADQVLIYRCLSLNQPENVLKICFQKYYTFSQYITRGLARGSPLTSEIFKCHSLGGKGFN